MKHRSNFCRTALLIIVSSLLVYPTKAQEAYVVDGDTIKIGDTTHRLHGIDAPEHGQRCNAPDGSTWDCGQAATNEMRRLLQLGEINCTSDGEDSYERKLSVCMVNRVNINEHMVQNGYAWAFRRYSNNYIAFEDVARIAKIGIWQTPTQTAWDFRSQKWTGAEQEAPNGCPIKGNISKNGHIYHTPWSPWYDRTRINEKKGERWFCDEAEALAAGWRAAIWN